MAAEMEIIRVKAAETFQGLNIEDFHTTSAEGNEFFSAEVLQHAVDVNRREAHRIAEFGLGDRQTERIVDHQPDVLQASQELAEKMSDTLLGATATHIHNGLAQRALVNQRCPP